MRAALDPSRYRRGALVALLAVGLAAAGSSVTISVEGDARVIRSNGIPGHAVGRFPGPGNPNRMTEQRHVYRVPLAPERAGVLTELALGPFGVAVNGVPFDPGAAEWWRGDPRSGWQVEALGPGVELGIDTSFGHVQPSGAYHYHGIPRGLLEELGADGSSMLLLGWAADGFPLYAPWGHLDPMDPGSPIAPLDSSWRLRGGERPGGASGPGGGFDGRYVEDHVYVEGAGDLDRCNGRFERTPEFPDGIYAYHLTESFPVIPRCFVGTPDPSFRLRGGPPGGPGPGPGHGPPPGHVPPPRGPHPW